MHETEELQTLQLLIRMNEKVSLERLAVLERNKKNQPRQDKAMMMHACIFCAG